jgi:hypothetical protein
VKVGFTGTREGYTAKVHNGLTFLLLHLCVTEFHHGCCIGSDAQAHHLAYECGANPIVGYPGPHDHQREIFDHQLHKVMPRSGFFARNRAIVDATDVLIATPRQMQLEAMGGTSYTVRYARKVGKKVYIVWPDGSIT